MTGESPGVAYREGSTVDRTIRIVVIVQAVLFVVALLYSKLRPLQGNQNAPMGS